MRPATRITKKILEFLGCLACLGMKFWTDIEARRVFYTRQKYSREWPLLHTIFWNLKGDAFAWITYGSYALITLFFGISICIDSKPRPIYAEKIFLLIGTLMFFGVGALVLASIDQVPDELIDNAIILGVLSFLVAFLFLVDMSEKMNSKGKTDATQTDTSSIDRHYTKDKNIGTVNSEINLIDHDENNGMSIQNQSIRSNGSNVNHLQSNENGLININQNDKNQIQSNSFNKFHVHVSPSNHDEAVEVDESFVSTDIVRAKTFPSIQMPAKVKQYPTVINHFDSEPYRKFFNRSSQQSSYSRYHDQTKMHGKSNETYFDEPSRFHQDTYYQAPKVDQLMVIRDYSNEHYICNCHDSEKHDDNVTIKSGYVSQVAKLWDDRSKNQDSHSFSPKNTNV